MTDSSQHLQCRAIQSITALGSGVKSDILLHTNGSQLNWNSFLSLVTKSSVCGSWAHPTPLPGPDAASVAFLGKGGCWTAL